LIRGEEKHSLRKGRKPLSAILSKGRKSGENHPEQSGFATKKRECNSDDKGSLFKHRVTQGKGPERTPVARRKKILKREIHPKEKC